MYCEGSRKPYAGSLESRSDLPLGTPYGLNWGHIMCKSKLFSCNTILERIKMKKKRMLEQKKKMVYNYCESHKMGATKNTL